MKCPFCSQQESKVIDSRVSASGDVIRRRRECESCPRRFTSRERVEDVLPTVVKKSGVREPFERDKVLRGVRLACNKRPVAIDRIERFVDELERELVEREDKEVDSREIGERVMRKLRELDEVAYVRFASVYRSFRDIDEFRTELENIARTRASEKPEMTATPSAEAPRLLSGGREVDGRRARKRGPRRPLAESRTSAPWSSKGEAVGVGHHARAGEEHAEVLALREADAKARGATLYVTLEPCNHVGRTPPCTDALVKAKLARIVVGCRDPNPHVEGGGIEKLGAAGLRVEVGCREEEAKKLIAPWSKFVTEGLPYVVLKLALSLDGRIASRTGASKWVTGPEARARVHLLRAEHDAIAVGIDTALADDPQLTVREAPGHSPLRVVFDTKLRLPVASRLVQSAREVPTWVICTTDAPSSSEQALAERGVEILRAPPSAEGRIDPAAALKLLASRGIVTLLVEGGAELAGSLLAATVVDQLHCFIAPILLGPRGRPGAVDWAGPATPAEAPSIGEPQWEVCGRDAHVWGPLKYPPR